MERKIGETFEFEGKTYEVVKDFTFSCRDCDFKKFCSPTKHISQEIQAPVECANTKRSDKENVIFKEIKKKYGNQRQSTYYQYPRRDGGRY